MKFTHNITRLHDFSAEIVSAVSQSKAYTAIAGRLTEDEKEIFKWGRNAKSHLPKSSTVAEYHASTGFEALLGKLFLTKQFSRLDEICEMALMEVVNFDKC